MLYSQRGNTIVLSEPIIRTQQRTVFLAVHPLSGFPTICSVFFWLYLSSVTYSPSSVQRLCVSDGNCSSFVQPYVKISMVHQFFLFVLLISISIFVCLTSSSLLLQLGDESHIADQRPAAYAMSSPTPSFPQFGRLPPEIRYSIWEVHLAHCDLTAMYVFDQQLELENQEQSGTVNHRPFVRVPAPDLLVNRESLRASRSWASAQGLEMRFRDGTNSCVFVRPWDPQRDAVFSYLFEHDTPYVIERAWDTIQSSITRLAITIYTALNGNYVVQPLLSRMPNLRTLYIVDCANPRTELLATVARPKTQEGDITQGTVIMAQAASALETYEPVEGAPHMTVLERSFKMIEIHEAMKMLGDFMKEAEKLHVELVLADTVKRTARNVYLGNLSANNREDGSHKEVAQRISTV